MRRGFWGYLFVYAFGYHIAACAQPIYENVPTPEPTGKTLSEDASDCRVRFSKSGHCLVWQWQKQPQGASDAGILEFKIMRPNQLDASLMPVEITDSVSVQLWMPSMGHGSSPTTTEQRDIGSYLTRAIFFIMPGEWELRFQIEKNNQVIDEAVVVVDI